MLPLGGDPAADGKDRSAYSLFRNQRRFPRHFHHFIDGFQVITDVKRLLYLLFLSAAVWIVDAAVIYSMFLAFSFDLPIVAAFVVMVILIAGIAIPTAPGFIGNWHYACILGLGLFGIAKPEAFSFALVYHFLSMLVVIILGVSFLPFNKFSISDLTGQMNKEIK
ncbi:MAG: hypothetical protein CVU51_16305 [Deltaproteobacteria bacterium HGW-Deltaproteobacteria-1]|nr:MAG: hypothetical protein CVU51_16305 [Deltaproteobacteria bacterium HGW-Deltaproteobacteria-1]